MNEIDRSIVQSNNQLAIDLYQKLRKTTGNLVFSPYSISTALAMVYAGARSTTAAQIAEVMHLPPDHGQVHSSYSELRSKMNSFSEHENNRLTVVDSVWLQEGYSLLYNFRTLLKQYYGLVISQIDYRNRQASCQEINAWIEEKTSTKIKDLIQPDMIDSLTRLMLVNAIYLKATWENQFAPDDTQQVPFWFTPTESIRVPMMNIIKGGFGYHESDDVRLLELPYIGRDLSMILLLPKEKDGLTKLETSLTVELLTIWVNALQWEYVNVFLPKFELSIPFRLREVLSSLGMPDAFIYHQADFSGMDGSHELFIGDVLQKAFILVDEEGTEAAAATGGWGAMGGPARIIFFANHPFVFLIRENETNTIIFLGRVVKPGK